MWGRMAARGVLRPRVEQCAWVEAGARRSKACAFATSVEPLNYFLCALWRAMAPPAGAPSKKRHPLATAIRVNYIYAQTAGGGSARQTTPTALRRLAFKRRSSPTSAAVSGRELVERPGGAASSAGDF